MTGGHGRTRRGSVNFRCPAGKEGRLSAGGGSSYSRRIQVHVPRAEW